MTTWRVGFTGTSSPVSKPQIDGVRMVLQEVSPTHVIEGHHGDCINADAMFHKIVCLLDRQVAMVIHPPDDDKKRAFCSGYATRLLYCTILEPRPYLDRNHSVVDSTDEMIAVPRTLEELRSGTWATVRYARKRGRQITIVWPDGSRTVEAATRQEMQERLL